MKTRCYSFTCRFVGPLKGSGVTCAAGVVRGTISATNSSEAWRHVRRLLVVTGVWDCTMRRGRLALKPKTISVSGGRP